MTSYLPGRIQTELTLPTGMPDEGGFAVAAQPAKGMMNYAPCRARFAKLNSYRTVMSIGVICLHPWLDGTGNFKSP